MSTMTAPGLRTSVPPRGEQAIAEVQDLGKEFALTKAGMGLSACASGLKKFATDWRQGAGKRARQPKQYTAVAPEDLISVRLLNIAHLR